MKVTVHLELSDAHWGHVIDKAAQLGMTPEAYIAGAAIGEIDDSLFEQEQYS